MKKHADLVELMLEQRAAMTRRFYAPAAPKPEAEKKPPDVTRTDAEPDTRSLTAIANE